MEMIRDYFRLQASLNDKTEVQSPRRKRMRVELRAEERKKSDMYVSSIWYLVCLLVWFEWFVNLIGLVWLEETLWSSRVSLSSVNWPLGCKFLPCGVILYI